MQTEDIVKIQAKVCPNFSKNIKISLDGISEAKSNIISLDVYSSKFNRCRNIFPHRLVRPLKKEFVENQEQLKKFLCDICDNSLTIDCAVGDNPKRSDFRLCLNHSALYACEYCFAKAVRITNKKSKSENPDISKTLILERIKKLEQTKNPENSKTIKILKKIVADLDKHKVSKCRQMTVWPSSTANQELRSKDSILQIVESIENHDSEDEPLSRDDVKGVIGRSLFLNIDYFDFVTSIPAEYMHLLCLGTVKRLTELTFNVGINRTRVTKRKLSSTKDFNLLMAQTKVFFESSRRARDLDFSVYKAEEFRNLILFFFPHVLSCVEETACERQLWLYLAFMVRSCIIPDNEFFNVNVSQITLACQKFYKLFEKTFGVTNCAYSLHVLCCHLLQIRQLGPLTETSAFLFESFYGELRNSFVPGTPAPLKQILENVFLKRAITPHSCEKSIYLTNYDTAKQSNSLIYTYEKDNINMYKVLDQIDGEVICNPQGKFVCEFTETPELSWSSVGVFKKGATTDEVIKLPHKAIAGKVLKVGLYLITCPENVLKEK